jgi:tetratricopeptide (TPR) repeat protein
MKTNRSILVSSAAFVMCAGLALSSFAQNPAPAQPPISQIEAAIKRAPLDLKLRLQLGFAYVNKDDFPHALEAFQEAVRLGPTSAEAHNWLGVALMEKSDLPGAVAELRKAVSLDPKYARAYTNLGSALARSGDISEAVTVFQKALVLEPESVPAHLNLALALREKGDLQSALLHLRRVVKADPKNAMVQYEFGQTLRQNGDLGGAIAAFEKAIEINPELQEGYYGLGLALKQQATATRKPVSSPGPADENYRKAQDALGKGDLNSARDLLVNAVRADDHNAEAHNLLGYILGQQGDLAFAINHLERAVELKPDYADGHYNLGVALWYKGTKHKSISELQESVRLDPAAGASYAFLGMALRETDDLPAARRNLQRAIALLPPTTATYIDLGNVYLRMGELDRGLGQFEAGLNAPSSPPTPDWDSAIAGLREALAKAPNRADAHNMLGLLLGRKGADSNEVLAEFREAIRLRPDFAAAHNNIGLVLTQSDDDEAAIAEFREAIRIQPNFADAHSNLGATFTATDVEQAIAELEKAVSLDPTSVKAQFNLAVAYGGSSNRDAGKEIEQLRKVISLSPTFARAHLALGKALIQEGNLLQAVSELREAVRLEPQSGEAHYQLGLALARVGKRDEGASEVRKGQELSAADERNQNANLDISEARAALNKSEIEEAVTKLRHAAKLAPESSEAQHFLGVALEKQGDVAGAAAAYQKATELNPGDSIARKNFERLALPDNPIPSERAESSEDDSAKIAEFEGYIRQNRFQEVESLLADYVKQHPNSSWGWYALGYSHFAQKKIGESIQALAKSLQIDIKNPEAHKILGRDLMIIGKFDAAQTEFEQGIRYDPKSAELHYNLGKLFSIQDNWENARKQFEEALRIDPAHIESLDALGLAQEALGDDAGAVASYNKAIALNEERHGNFFAPEVNLSSYYNRVGDSAKAMEFAQKALNLDPKSDKAWFQKARAEEHQGKLQEAADSLNRAISFNERASSYYYVLAGVYRRLGKTADSQKALESFTRLDRENNELEKMRRSMSKPNGAPAAGGERE